jgi:hypothetical protein
MNFHTAQESVENFMQVFLLLVYMICPIVLFFVIIKNRSKIHRESYWLKIFKLSKAYKNKLEDIFPIYRSFGKQLFYQTKTDSYSTVILDVIFIVRRMILAYTLVFMGDYPVM